MNDIVYSGYFRVESNNVTEKTSTMYGAFGLATHDSSSTSGGVSNMAGLKGQSDIQDYGDVDNAYGVWGQVNIANNRNANVDATFGVVGEIQIDEATELTYGTMAAVRGIIDNNEGSVPNFGTQYLFHGDYQGTQGTGSYGLYVEGSRHYLSNKLGVGTNDPDYNLDVNGNIGINDYIYHNGDSNTRIGFSGNDSFIVRTNGTDRLTVNSSGDSTFAGKVEIERANAQLQLTDTDDDTFTEFSSSGNKLAIRQNSTTANHLWLLDNGDFGIGVQPNNKLHIDSSYTNSVKIQGTGTHSLFSYHDSGGVGWATGSGVNYDNLIYFESSGDRINFYTGGTRRCFVSENGQLVIGETPTVAAANTNAKLIVGGIMSTGSSAIIQANGFMRLKDYVIVHSNTTTSNAGLLQYNDTGYFYTIEGSGKNHFTIGTSSTSYLNGISGTQTTLKVASSNVACLLLHSTATNGVAWQNYSASNGTLNWYNDIINLNCMAISNFDGSTASSNAFNTSQLRLHSSAKTGWGIGDILGQISFYNSDTSGIGARDAVFIKAVNTQGNGSSTTTFSGALEIHTSSYNANTGKCATFTAGKGLDVVGPIVMTGGNGNYQAGIDYKTDAGFIMQQTHKFYSLANSDQYLRNLIEHTSSNHIVMY